MSLSKITVEATIAANTKKVWDYYTNPVHIVNWNFAGDDWHCPKAENDLRVGGRCSSRMEAKDGSFGFDFNTIYEEIIDQKLIAYAMEDGRKAKIDFIDNGNSTFVSICFDPESKNPMELQKGGWQMILNNFKKYTEQN